MRSNMDDSILRLVQMSDSHLFADKEGALLGVKTQESFRAVVNLIKQQTPQPNLIIHSGDLSQDGKTEAYIHLATELKSLNIPVYWCAGNHDDFKIVKKVYPYEGVSNQKHIILRNWQIILLDTHKSHSVEGYLDEAQLAFLTNSLQSYPQHHSVIFFHHHPFSVGCQWLDPIGLNNAKEFWDIATRFANIKGVFFGHVHQEYFQMMRGIPCYSAPSTCFQFKPKQVNFALENIPPGFRWIELLQDGSIKTEIRRVAKYVGKFEEDAKGY